MKNASWIILRLMGACSLMAALGCLAGPLQRADVPAEPAWVAHLDCDRLRPTAMGKWLLSELDKPEAQEKLSNLQMISGFDARKQLHGVTLYSASSNPDNGVLVAYADFDAERLVTLAKSAKEYESASHRTYTIHSWLDENKKPKDGVPPRTYAAISGKRVIFGQQKSSVAAALDVIDGVSPTLAKSGAYPQIGGPRGTNFVQAFARKLDMSDNDPNAAVFKMSKLLRLEVGESQEKVTAALTLEANSQEIATQISTILQGVVAFLKLQKDKPENAKIAEAITLKQDTANVVATLQMPAAQVVETINAIRGAKEQKKGQ